MYWSKSKKIQMLAKLHVVFLVFSGNQIVIFGICFSTYYVNHTCETFEGFNVVFHNLDKRHFKIRYERCSMWKPDSFYLSWNVPFYRVFEFLPFQSRSVDLWISRFISFEPSELGVLKSVFWHCRFCTWLVIWKLWLNGCNVIWF